jgi:hypothetical protein
MENDRVFQVYYLNFLHRVQAIHLLIVDENVILVYICWGWLARQYVRRNQIANIVLPQSYGVSHNVLSLPV